MEIVSTLQNDSTDECVADQREQGGERVEHEQADVSDRYETIHLLHLQGEVRRTEHVTMSNL